ncbi:MAG: hypothetical protein JW940_04455 [Polyangiaceae bacterium]|nr:hypothetical protein [Polyangiaceae bacterium]
MSAEVPGPPKRSDTQDKLEGFLDAPHLETLCLTLSNVTTAARIDPRVLEYVKPPIYKPLNVLCENLILSVCRYWPTEWRRSVAFPADWWQALKERWAPKWLLRRWPVRRRVFDALAFYPTMRSWRDFGQSILRVKEKPGPPAPAQRMACEALPFGEEVEDFGLQRYETIQRWAEQVCEEDDAGYPATPSTWRLRKALEAQKPSDLDYLR